MSKPISSWNGIPVALIALLGSLSLRSDAPAPCVTRMSALPPITLWAWERREDLRSIDTRRYAIAYLDRTLTIGLNVASQPRRDPVAFPAAAARIPVVRIEAPRNAILDDENRAAAVRAILEAARGPGIAALQIDFDATRSQREFYRALLGDVRRQMPDGLPLSITALASWCSWDSWLGDLPIDEAVPMLFRMEPDRHRAPPGLDQFRIREPLCESSAGVSTDEPWPEELAGKRIYIFPGEGWRANALAELGRRLQ